MSTGLLSRPTSSPGGPSSKSGPIEDMTHSRSPLTTPPTLDLRRAGNVASEISRPVDLAVSERRAARWEVMRTAKIRGMSRQRKPKHPGGRPAVFGPRQNLVAVRVDDRMYDELETHAEEAGLPLALYCMLRLAELHDIELPERERLDRQKQEQLPLGAA